MSKRVTCIAMFSEGDLEKVAELVSGLGELCKVPLFVEGRESVDTLPYHTTVAVWGAELEDEVVRVVSGVEFGVAKLRVEGVGVWRGQSGWNLRLIVEGDEVMRRVQGEIFEKLPSEKYDPETYELHITLHSDEDREKALAMKEKVEAVFEPFEIGFSELGCFEIYPARKVF